MQVMVIYPRRVLTSAALVKLDVGVLRPLAEMKRESGFSVREIEQFVHFTGRLPERSENRRFVMPESATIARFAKLDGGPELAKKLLRTDKVEEAEIDGKKYFHRTTQNQPRYSPSNDAICFLDDRTILIADSPETLHKMFSANNAKSPIAAALRAIDPAADFALLLSNQNGELAGVIKTIPDFPESLAGLPDVLTMARFTVKATPEVSFALELSGKDEAAATRLARMVDAGKQLAAATLPAFRENTLAHLPDAEKPAAEEFLRLAERVITAATPQQAGNRVTVRIDHLVSTEELAAKILAPEIASIQRRIKRIAPPVIDPTAAGKAAIKMYDANGDGVISGDELDKCPALKKSLRRYEDSPGSGKVTAKAIAARIQEWIDSRVAIMSTMVQVRLDGQPLEGATFTLEAEPFLGGGIETVTATTDAHGMANLMIDGDPKKPPQERLPGIRCGLYKVRISKTDGDTETIPKRYNSETTLGIEAAQGNPDFQMGAQRFELTSK